MRNPSHKLHHMIPPKRNIKKEHTVNMKSLYAKQKALKIILCHGAFLTARKTWSSIDQILVNSTNVYLLL